MLNRFSWFARDDITRDGVSLYAFNEARTEHLTTVFAVNKREPGDYVEPSMHLSREEAQQLLNELWAVGYRPRDGAGSLAHVDAQKAHLEDMRRLVFKGSGPSEPT